MRKNLKIYLVLFIIIILIYIFKILRFHKPTIFCIILTNPRNFYNKTLAVNSTWVQECDEYRFITVIPQFYINLTRDLNKEPHKPYKGETVQISYPYKMLQPSDYSEKSFGSLSVKMFNSFKDIHKLYPNYDWYLKADDDTYIFMDHLREFLWNKNPSDLLSFGYNLKLYQSGRAGYVISNKVLNILGEKMIANQSFWENHNIEDLDVGGCLRALGVTMGRTEDSLGRERFHPYNLKEHMNGITYKWMYLLSIVPVQNGTGSSSSTTISYHYMTPDDIVQIHTVWKAFQKLKAQNINLDFHEFVLKRML